MPRLTVTEDTDGGPWRIELDGVLLDTVRGHYGAWEVLQVAEGFVDTDASWRRTDDGGFEAVIPDAAS